MVVYTSGGGHGDKDGCLASSLRACLYVVRPLCRKVKSPKSLNYRRASLSGPRAARQGLDHETFPIEDVFLASSV